MKKISITDSEKKLLLIVLALGILAASYFFGFTKLNEVAAEIEASNEKDEATKNQLEGMVARQAATERETESFKQGIKDIISKYPSDIPQAKAIYLVQEFQNIIGTDVDTMGFAMNRHVQSFSGDDAPTGKYANLTIQYSASYDQFKELLRYAAAFPDRTTLPSVTANFDQVTGLLKGTFNYKMYYLSNTDKAYEEFPPTEIPSGKAGIFYPGEWAPTLESEDLQ